MAQSIYKVYEDDSFVTGDSPVTHDVLTDLEHYATGGQVSNWGTGDMYIKVEGNRVGKRSTLNDTIVLASAESIRVPARSVFDLGSLNMNIMKIQTIWIADTAYTITVA